MQKRVRFPLNQSFGYDDLDRLTAANADTFDLGYTYDANGNRTEANISSTAQVYSIDSASNRLTAIDATSYQYDANGNILSDGSHNYGFDARNRLVTVDDGATATYDYNAFGERIYKQAKTQYQLTADLNGDGRVTPRDLFVLHRYIRNHQSPPEADLNQDGKVNYRDMPCVATRIGKHPHRGNPRRNHKANVKLVHNQGTKGHKRKPKHQRPKFCQIGEWIEITQDTRFVYEGPHLLGEYINGKAQQETIWLDNLPIATVQNDELHYVHTDQLGTPRAITESRGTVVWSWVSDPFGESKPDEDPDSDGVKLTYNLRFPGQYYDQETGLYYNYYRYYDPATGRYITSDPIGLEGGLNTYAYVGGNPLSMIDPNGLSGIMIWPWPDGPFGSVCGSGSTASFIPDGPYKDACLMHDVCYATCGTPKYICDLLLLYRTGNAVYYAAVSTFGDGPYKNAQKENCKGTCN